MSCGAPWPGLASGPLPVTCQEPAGHDGDHVAVTSGAWPVVWTNHPASCDVCSRGFDPEVCEAGHAAADVGEGDPISGKGMTSLPSVCGPCQNAYTPAAFRIECGCGPCTAARPAAIGHFGEPAGLGQAQPSLSALRERVKQRSAGYCPICGGDEKNPDHA